MIGSGPKMKIMIVLIVPNDLKTKIKMELFGHNYLKIEDLQIFHATLIETYSQTKFVSKTHVDHSAWSITTQYTLWTLHTGNLICVYSPFVTSFTDSINSRLSAFKNNIWINKKQKQFCCNFPLLFVHSSVEQTHTTYNLSLTTKVLLQTDLIWSCLYNCLITSYAENTWIAHRLLGHCHFNEPT